VFDASTRENKLPEVAVGLNHIEPENEFKPNAA
jgi:hypothetical protein